MRIDKFLLATVKILLFGVAFTLLIKAGPIFPFVFGKIIFFRSLIEIALVLFLIYLARKLYYNSDVKSLSIIKTGLKNPLFISLLIFSFSLITSVIFSANPYRAFWGDIERGEGLFGIFHYFIFFILAVLVFDKKSWLNFFKVFLTASVPMFILAILQMPYFGVENLPFALGQEIRAGSLLGNPAFLASYSIFVILFSAIIFIYAKGEKREKMWRWFSGVLGAIGFIMIFATGTRGAILGLAVAALFLLTFFSIKGKSIFYKKLSIQKLSIGLLALGVIFTGIFWFTRSNSFWQNIPGFDRLARTELFDKSDPSTRIRLMTWQLSLEAFKEKPIFGWGQDNYLAAYQKYFNPDMSLYGETWIDRAHNKLLDILVMQGIFGLLAYLGIFGSLIYLFSRIISDIFYVPFHVYRAMPFIIAGIIAYFVQNFFVFDHVASYIPFFALLGFIFNEYTNPKDNKMLFGNSLTKKENKSGALRYISGIFILFAVGAIYSIYAYNYVPFRQARAFWDSSKITGVDAFIAKMNEAMYPYNFAQYNIRGTGVDTIYMSQYFEDERGVKNPKFKPVGDILLESMDEIIRKEPYDVRIFIKKVEMLNNLAYAQPDQSKKLYEEAGGLIRKAIELAPKRQELHYHLAFNLANQSRFEEAIASAKYAIELSPNISRAHYHLGSILFLKGDIKIAMEEFEIMEKLDPGFGMLFPSDINNVFYIYSQTGRSGKIAKMVKNDLENGIFRLNRFANIALLYYSEQHDKKNFIELAENLNKNFPDLREVMDVFIRLAEQDKWNEIIENLNKLNG